LFTKPKRIAVLIALAAVVLNISVAFAADWPMWRYNAAHTASCPEQLPAQLHLQWVRKLPKPQPAWPPHQYKLQFDLSYEPVVVGKSIFVPSMVTDSVTAYDTESGAEEWRFYSDGPVRFAPLVWQGAIYFVSDDGYLYCLDAENGSLKWKYRGGPSDRKILGNDRLISTWPARGAPVLYDGTIYFAAGIWPFMGTFIHALDAETGDVVWTNSETGPIFVRQPHNDPAFSGVAPQGYIAACEAKLIVTGGRSRPAVFDRKTGKLLYFKHSDNSQGKFRGGYDIAIWRKWFFNFDVMYNLSDGGAMATVSAPVLSQDAVIGLHKDGDLMGYIPQGNGKAKGLWKVTVDPKLSEIYLRAGDRIYGSDDKGGIAAVDIPKDESKAVVSWRYDIREDVFTMIAADGKLFVVTTQGAIYCFGGKEVNPRHYDLINTQMRPVDDASGETVEHLLEGSSQNQGYCLMLGIDNDLLAQLSRQSKYHIIVTDPDTQKIADLRATLSRAGLYGTRATALAGDIDTIQLPPYFANLIVSTNLADAGFTPDRSTITKLFETLRPYGGKAFLPSKTKAARKWQRNKWVRRGSTSELTKAIKSARLPNASVSHKDGFVRIERVGALPGSADWTHQYGDIANTVCSKDSLVKAPLGLLWFGDNVDFGEVLPRHGHGPPEQVIAGRLFMQGLDSISARDVYTGQTLWKTPLADLNAFGVYYDNTFVDDFRDTTYNQGHIAGANARGTNFVATADSVYIIQDRGCDVLDAETGENLKTFTIPDLPTGESAEWGYIGVYKDYLIAGAGFVEYSKLIGQDTGWLRWTRYADKIASKQLVVMDRHTGKIRWSMTAKFGFIHNAVAVGKNRIFCLDKTPPFITKFGAESATGYRLLAIDVRTGKIKWQNDHDVFGGWLGYSREHDILIQGDWPQGDRMGPWKHHDRIIAYRGANGKVIWDKPITYNGPYILHNDTIITQGGKSAKALSLLTGEDKMRNHPVTGESVPWEYTRLKGCNTAIGSEHLLTFRSAAAGFFDLTNDGGTGNLGGFKSGCTSNLVVANGVLNAPDYTQTCNCSYQNQTSLALVHMSEADLWTFNTIGKSAKPIKRVGINFGAPGDRKAPDETLWLDYPSVGGTSPDVDVKISPNKPKWYRSDTSQIESGPLKWVTASGVEGLKEIRITLAKEQTHEGLYTVRLYFSEPEHTQPNQRIFDVAIQGQKVMENFDIISCAGAANIGIVKEFNNIKAGPQLVVTMTPSAGGGAKKTVICGVEIIAQQGQ
jgi:outer membrane protein assembly factor BamB